MYGPETEARLRQLEAIRRERDFTDEEEKEIVRIIREDRVSASYASKGAKAKATASKVTPEQALEKLKGLFAAKGETK